MLNADRVERRKSFRILMALRAFMSKDVDKQWFEAMAQSTEEAEAEYARFQVRRTMDAPVEPMGNEM